MLFATPADPEDQSVGNVAGMQVEEVRSAVVGFEYSPETNPVLDILKWRRRLFTSLRALSARSGVHSVSRSSQLLPTLSSH
jgi:hypothetical protein